MLRCRNVGTLQTGVAARQGNLTMRRMISASAAGRGQALRGLSPVVANAGFGGRVRIPSGSALVGPLGSGSQDLRRASLAGLRVQRTYNSTTSTTSTIADVGGDTSATTEDKPHYTESLLDIAKEGTSPQLRALREQQLRQQEREEEGEEYDGHDRNGDERDIDAGQEGSESKLAGELEKANVSMRLEAAVRKELTWLSDPKELAQRVRRALQKKEVRFAATLVRQAHRRKMGSAAAWNHLIEYCFEQDEPAAAWKFYQEMKKRQRHPNPFTYTLMLSGLGKTARREPIKKGDMDTMKAAYAVYKNILDPKNPIQANVIFANAMLITCLHHGNMESLWAVAADLPQEGPLAPDEKTYTIILRAINYSVERDIAAIPESDVEHIIERKNQAVVEAKRVWSEVAYLWREGRLAVDNYLVNIMGRLLLHGTTDRDLFDVFYLYKQASGIPIMGKEPPREPIRPKTRVSDEDKLELDEDTHSKPISDPDADFIPFEDNEVKLYRPPPTEESVGEPEEEENFEGLFDPVVPEDSSKIEPNKGEPAVAKEVLVEGQESPAEENPAIIAESSPEDGSQLAGSPTDKSLSIEASDAEPQPAELESYIGRDAQIEDENVPARIKKQRIEAKPLVTPEYLNPTNTTLSIILDACLSMNQGTSNGRAYWQLFTQHYCGPRLRPNSDTSHRYLRLLRKSHSSRLVTQVLKHQMAPIGLLEGKTFSIAISCCRRDRNNPNVLENAAEILHLMEEAAALPYTRPLETYISLIQSFEKNPQRLTTLNGFDLGKSKNKSMKRVGRDLLGNLWLGAANALRPHVARLHEALQQKEPTPFHVLRPRQKEVAVSSSEALRCMVKTRAILDSLLDDDKLTISTEDRKELKKESEMLKQYSDVTAVKKFGNSKGAVMPTREQRKDLERRKEQAAEERLKDKETDAGIDKADHSP